MRHVVAWVFVSGGVYLVLFFLLMVLDIVLCLGDCKYILPQPGSGENVVVIVISGVVGYLLYARFNRDGVN